MANGPGLVEGVVNIPTYFNVIVPSEGKLEVKVVGPHSEAKVAISVSSRVHCCVCVTSE